MRVLVCGSRNFQDYAAILTALRSAGATVVIHGCARGADELAARAAKELRIPEDRYPAAWATHVRAAGPIRNQRMLDDGTPDLVLAFFAGERTPGTSDMVRRARAAGVSVQEFGLPPT